MKTLKN